MAQIKDGSSFLDGKKIPKSINGQYADDNGNIQIEAFSSSEDIADNPVTFTEASERTNIQSGESTATLFGKVKKWFTDLRALAFKDTISSSDLDSSLSATINNKVDKEEGKGLSTNDFTNGEKSKLSGIAEGAEVNVQADWNESTNTSDAYIRNKPTYLSEFVNDLDMITSSELESALEDKVDKVAGKGLSTNDFTNEEKSKLAGIATGAEANVQSDWDETNSYSDAYILNKPTIPTSTSDLYNDSGFVVDSDYVHTDNNYTTTEKNKLAGITSGAEPNVQSDWNTTSSTSDSYIRNKPTALSDFTNDSGFITSSSLTASNISNTAISGLNSRNVQSSLAEIYSDLTDVIDGTTTVPYANRATYAGTADTATTLNGNSITYVMNYNNLTNKPDIPTYTRYTTTLYSSSWSSSAPYTQTRSISGILSTDNPIVDVILSTTSSEVANEKEAWSCVDDITTSSGSITVTCYETKPTTTISIQLLVIRN